MALAFVLGLVSTGLFTVRRITREVPVYASVSGTPGAAAAAEVVESSDEPEEPPGDPGFTRVDEDRSDAAGFAVAAADVPPSPHGPGSAVPNADGSGPAAWPVKANEESMLYHSPESPSYDVIRAEVWFRDVATAEAAGFNRWDSGKSQRGRKKT